MPKSKKYSTGDRVKILRSSHSDVIPNTIGEVVDRLENGYSVKMESIFNFAGRSVKETRTIFFQEDEITTP